MKMHDDTKILAIDLAKVTGVWCAYAAPSGDRTYGKVRMTPQAMHDLLVERAPERLVIEISSNAGWVHDLAESLDIAVEVANPNHEGWRWTHVKRKSDRRDALKLAELSAMNQLPMVHMPPKAVREWRSLIAYRQSLVRRRTQVKNNIRSILDREGEQLPPGRSGWTNKAITYLEELASVQDGALWRFMLETELRLLKTVHAEVQVIEAKLNRVAAEDRRVALLKTVPAVGDRLAETIVAIINEPRRFNRGRDVGSYVGLTPRQYQSGSMDRQGRISGQGSKILRSLLVQVSWIGVSRLKVPWMVDTFERICRGSQQRRKIAIIAVARKLLIRCWAMLRDDSPWREPAECRLRLAA